MILRAHVVLPVSGPPIRNGAVGISSARISAVGKWREVAGSTKGKVVDLGDSVLMPGLVNAHCHLDYTHMAGQFPPPKVFTDWLKVITSTKAGWSLADYEASWKEGASMLLRTGTTTVADIEAVPQLLPAIWKSTPLRVFSFLEMIGITSRRPPELVLRETVDKIVSLGRKRGRLGFSPHAPYSTVPELLRRCAQTARRRRSLVCTHVAESRLEFEMFTAAKGQMFDWLQRSGRDMSDCGLGSPIEHLGRCGLLGPDTLAVHVNYLNRTDVGLLGRSRTTVVHCPRSHMYFRHDALPLRRLKKGGVNLCLGTDSLASVCQTRRQKLELNMFEEMRALAQLEPSYDPRQILRLATVKAARALRLEGQVGQLAPGALADLIVVPMEEGKDDPYETVLHHRGHVAASMIGGRWAIPPASTLASPVSYE
jgi:cytosine/adenosine deaminase-related metal-dependent hydrolase